MCLITSMGCQGDPASLCFSLKGEFTLLFSRPMAEEQCKTNGLCPIPSPVLTVMAHVERDMSPSQLCDLMKP